jgi:hypothetical protein
VGGEGDEQGEGHVEGDLPDADEVHGSFEVGGARGDDGAVAELSGRVIVEGGDGAEMLGE